MPLLCEYAGRDASDALFTLKPSTSHMCIDMALLRQYVENVKSGLFYTGVHFTIPSAFLKKIPIFIIH